MSFGILYPWFASAPDHSDVFACGGFNNKYNASPVATAGYTRVVNTPRTPETPTNPQPIMLAGIHQTAFGT
jgi:hypothetical protein